MILDNKNAVYDVRFIKPKKKLRLKRSVIAILLFVNIIFPELLICFLPWYSSICKLFPAMFGSRFGIEEGASQLYWFK